MFEQRRNRQTFKLIVWLVFLILVENLPSSETKQCIKTMVGLPCKEDHDCFEQDENHLYCNTTLGANVCAYHFETYIGQVQADVDCEGEEYSAVPWSNPVPQGLMKVGVDCMRMCLHTYTCFGITVYEEDCFLKNELCFANLKHRPGAIIGVLNVVREDYRCGCHYPISRTQSDGQILHWNPDCPESQLTRNPFRCCSERGLCVECKTGEEPNPNPRKVRYARSAQRTLLPYARIR